MVRVVRVIRVIRVVRVFRVPNIPSYSNYSNYSNCSNYPNYPNYPKTPPLRVGFAERFLYHSPTLWAHIAEEILCQIKERARSIVDLCEELAL